MIQMSGGKARSLALAVIVSAVCAFPVTELRAQTAPSVSAVSTAEKPRVIVLTDIGNEPDDSESMVRFLLYTNDFDVEALIATTSRHQKERVQPELISERVKAYGEVLPNLRAHDTRYPDMSYLMERIYSGQNKYGMVGVGSDKDTAGSEAIIRIVDRAQDERPVWVLVWGGATDLAQALTKVRQTRTPQQVDDFVAKLRVYSISDQDDAGPWIRHNFNNIFWIVSLHGYGKYKLATWSGISGEKFYNLDSGGPDSTKIANEWLDKNIRLGALGAMYPEWKFIMEGDTPSFLYLIPNGLGSPEHPEYGSWGGRYERTSAFDNIYTNTFDTVTGANDGQFQSPHATIWRWRDAYQDDFANRIRWSLSPKFSGADHNPKVMLNGQVGVAPLMITATSGDKITLSAKGTTDPDGDDLHYRWFQYREVGNYKASPEVSLDTHDPVQATFILPKVKEPTPLHVVLEVSDSATLKGYAYRRAVITINPQP